MNFDGIPTEVWTLGGVLLTALCGWLGVRTKSRSDKEASLPEGWQRLTSEMRTFFTEQLAERDARLDAFEEEGKERTQYIQYATSMWRGVELWAARNGHELPPPPFKTFPEWQASHHPHD